MKNFIRNGAVVLALVVIGAVAFEWLKMETVAMWSHPDALRKHGSEFLLFVIFLVGVLFWVRQALRKVGKKSAPAGVLAKFLRFFT